MQMQSRRNSGISVDELCRRGRYIDDIQLNLEIVGGYSVDGKGEYQENLSQLKYYKEPANIKNTNFNLDANENTICKTNVSNIKMDFMLKWISNNLDSLRAQNTNDSTRWLDAEFISYRGTLKIVFCTPFNKFDDGWIICAAKFKGTIYLCEFDTDIIKAWRLKENTDNNIAWGYKFEQYLVSDAPDKNPDLSVPLNQNEEFCFMFKSKFGNKTLLYGAEVDGICSNEVIKDTVAGKKLELIELKTIPDRCITDDGYIKDINRTLSYWAQSYLVDIKTIICGAKDNNHNGIVKKLHKVRPNEFQLNKRIKDMQRECKSFCNSFLSFVKDNVVEEHDKCLYKFTFEPRMRPKRITIDKLKPDPDSNSEYTFLHSWYIEKLENYFANK